MSARAIVPGSLHNAAELRTSKNGNPFATFTIRESLNNGAARWWQAIAFSETAIEALKELAVAEPIAVAGELDCELYAPAGAESRLSWKITADAVLSARAKPKRSKPQDGHQPFETKRWGGPDDAVPF
jgi:hypothetical protein